MYADALLPAYAYDISIIMNRFLIKRRESGSD
jgi:hypothetical protein